MQYQSIQKAQVNPEIARTLIHNQRQNRTSPISMIKKFQENQKLANFKKEETNLQQATLFSIKKRLEAQGVKSKWSNEKRFILF